MITLGEIMTCRYCGQETAKVIGIKQGQPELVCEACIEDQYPDELLGPSPQNDEEGRT